jgi:hypothetical protein
MFAGSDRGDEALPRSGRTTLNARDGRKGEVRPHFPLGHAVDCWTLWQSVGHSNGGANNNWGRKWRGFARSRFSISVACNPSFGDLRLA